MALNLRYSAWKQTGFEKGLHVKKIMIPMGIWMFVAAGCGGRPHATAWEHLQMALENDEASVIEYMAIEHLSPIIAYDLQASVEETIFLDPERALRFLMVQYPSVIAEAAAEQMPELIIDRLLGRNPAYALDRLLAAEPDRFVDAAVRADPYRAFDRALQGDPFSFIRRAIDQNPRYAAEYLNNYYGNVR